jgi:hypothetical protein
MITFLPELAAEHRVLNEKRILVAVADDERLGIAMDGKRGQQFRLRSGLHAEMKRPPRVHDFLNDLPELVYLDRKDSAIRSLESELLDRRVESPVYLLDAVPKQILESENKGKSETVFSLCLLDNLHQIDRRLCILRGAHLDATLWIDREVAESPTVNIVE